MNFGSRSKLSQKEVIELQKYVKFFVYKISQVIVQSRFGKNRRVHATGKTGHDWFNLDIQDNAEILTKVKDAYNVQSQKDFHMCTEIMLKTADGDILVLEVWNLKMDCSDCASDSPYISYTSLASVYSRMTLVMKSVIAFTRMTPAFKLSLRQSADTFVILYRIYNKPPMMNYLGDNYVDCKIGEILSPIGRLKMSVSYRSKEDMTITPREVQIINPTTLENDYFYPEKHQKKKQIVSENQKLIKFEEQCQGEEIKEENFNEIQKIGAFALSKSLNETFPDLEILEKPFLNVSRSKINSPCNLVEDLHKISDKNANEKDYSVDFNCNANEETFRNIETDKDDFVFIEKPPFADGDRENDLGAFFRECQNAPALKSFSTQPTLEEQVSDITSQLEMYETSMTDFDCFVNSICHVNSSSKRFNK